MKLSDIENSLLSNICSSRLLISWFRSDGEKTASGIASTQNMFDRSLMLSALMSVMLSALMFSALMLSAILTTDRISLMMSAIILTTGYSYELFC